MDSRVVGVDGATEMREMALEKLQDAGKSNVELWVDDLFSWQPDQDYDVVFFAFWLSHVPESHTDRFWRSVHDALRPGGRFFLVDAARAVLDRNVIDGSRLPDREIARPGTTHAEPVYATCDFSRGSGLPGRLVVVTVVLRVRIDRVVTRRRLQRRHLRRDLTRRGAGLIRQATADAFHS